MSSSIVITIATIGAFGWLSFLAVAALRSRHQEEVPANLAPGTTDDVLETKRLERAQQAAVLLSAFLAIGLPLYYLGENLRQDSFVEQFDEESVERGAHLVEEFQCYSCHGPDGVGGAASYVEKRTGVDVSWAAPSLNDVLYRYSPQEVNFWVTFGRGNTPMPAWGLAGGGPMNEQQVKDVVNYLETIQIESQQEVLQKVDGIVAGQLQSLAQADDTLHKAIIEQKQVVADVEAAPSILPIAQDLATRIREAFDLRHDGIDTDGDGVSDRAEQAISDISLEAERAFSLPGLEAIAFEADDPESTGRPDADTAAEVRAVLEALLDRAPILQLNVEAIDDAAARAAEDTAAATDTDADGVPDVVEQALTAELAVATTEVKKLTAVPLDPTSVETSAGETDDRAASEAVAALESLVLNLSIQVDNQDRLLPTVRASLDRLEVAATERRWDVDLDGVADAAFGGDREKSDRAVGLFLGYCARCHTSDWSAGPAFAQEPGAGGFGPALWVGRASIQFLDDSALPVSQFLTVEDLAVFLYEGPRANRPYGVNGLGSGRMPAFGKILSADDLELIATYLRSGNLNGKG